MNLDDASEKVTNNSINYCSLEDLRIR